MLEHFRRSLEILGLWAALESDSAGVQLLPRPVQFPPVGLHCRQILYHLLIPIITTIRKYTEWC